MLRTSFWKMGGGRKRRFFLRCSWRILDLKESGIIEVMKTDEVKKPKPTKKVRPELKAFLRKRGWCLVVMGIAVMLLTVGILAAVLGKKSEERNEELADDVPKAQNLVGEKVDFAQQNPQGEDESANHGVSAEMVAAIKSERYYIAKNLERYLSYASANADLSVYDIVRNVNANLDHTRYVDVKDADLSHGVLAMINKYNYLGTYEPDDLVRLGEGYTNATAPMLRREAAEAFVKMAEAARDEGLTLMNISGYRSYNVQDRLYNNYVAVDGQALADTYSSRPGYSEHQAGLATDINSVEVSFANTPEFRWLQEHAADYGFIMRYPDGLEYITGFSYEPWHYRYVGVDAAQQIVREGLTFDEYYAYYVEQ